VNWKTVWIRSLPKPSPRDVGRVLVNLLLLGSLCLVISLALCWAWYAEAYGAECLLAWSPVTTDTNGALIEGAYYEIYEGDVLRAVTFDTSLVIVVSADRLSYRLRACVEGRPCSDYSSAVTARVVSFMPAYATESKAVYFGEPGVDLLVVLYPHPDDSLFIAHEGGAEFIRWQTFLDFNGDGWLSLSDLARLGLLYILQYMDPGLFMFKSAGGKIDLSDVALFGEMYHGSATREWSSEGRLHN